MNSKISIVNAKDGGLEFELSNGEIIGIFRDPFKIKYTIVSHGILDNVAFGRSMDNASNYGFDSNDGAIKLFEKSILGK